MLDNAGPGIGEGRTGFLERKIGVEKEAEGCDAVAGDQAFSLRGGLGVSFLWVGFRR